MKKPFLKNKIIWWLAGAILIAGVGGFILLSQAAARKAETAEPPLQTAKVRTGDLIVSSAGSGSILSQDQVELGFRSGGVISSVNVKTGQKVIKGDILVSLENSTQQAAFEEAKVKLENLFSPHGIALYQLELVNAQTAYDEADKKVNASETGNAYEDEIAIRKAAVVTAQETVGYAEDNYSYYVYISDDDPYKIKALADLAEARMKLEEAQANLSTFESKSFELEKESLSANLEITQTRLTEAQIALEIVQSGDLTALENSLTATDGTALSKLKAEYLAYENARIALENTYLTAPFDGVVTKNDLAAGQSVGSNPVITLASLDTLMVKFYMDETDLAGLAIGNRTIYTFNAYPDTYLEGEAVSIDPSLQNVDGSPVIVVWGTLPEQPSFDLLIGMTVDVEIIAGEAKDALIIPIQALREITQDSFAVFVVQSDGSLKLTPVKIGLRDFANAEVLSGLEAGDVISTGTVETK